MLHLENDDCPSNEPFTPKDHHVCNTPGMVVTGYSTRTLKVKGMVVTGYSTRTLKVKEIWKMNSLGFLNASLRWSCGVDLKEANYAELECVYYVKKIHCNEPIEKLYTTLLDLYPLCQWSTSKLCYHQCEDCKGSAMLRKFMHTGLFFIFCFEWCDHFCDH